MTTLAEAQRAVLALTAEDLQAFTLWFVYGRRKDQVQREPKAATAEPNPESGRALEEQRHRLVAEALRTQFGGKEPARPQPHFGGHHPPPLDPKFFEGE
jgi:hypothetical protein